MGRLRRRKSCRRLRSAMKKKAQSRNLQRVRPQKNPPRRNKSVKARANGAAAAAVEEAEETVLRIAAPTTRQPAIMATVKNRWKPHRKSMKNRSRKAAR